MITPQIAIDFLTLDDGDGYLVNGTPHRAEICAGFGAHGFECPVLGTGLFVQPPNGLASSGVRGEAAFEPGGINYSLTNLNDTAIDYSVAAGESWVTLSSPSGTIPAHESATVTLGIDQTEAATKTYGTYRDTVIFTNTTNHDGDTTRPAELTVAIARYTLGETEPTGWPAPEGEWAFGVPGGSGGEQGCPDPSAAATGDNVYGVNLSGDYSAAPGGPYYLTTGQIDLTGTVDQKLRFKRWLNTDHWPYAEATVEASPDNTDWTVLWSSGWLAIDDGEWTTQTYDLSDVVGTATEVYVRWGYQIYPGARAYSGWNIDDVEFLGDAAP
jgi:hypothetical protein